MKRLLISLILALGCASSLAAASFSTRTNVNFTLAEWELLTVTTGVDSSGVVVRLSNVPGGGNSLGSWPIATSGSLTIGPYAIPTRFDIRPTTGTISYSNEPANFIVSGGLVVSDIDATDSPADEECLTYEATGPALAWQSCGGGAGTIGGSLGSTDDALVCSDGTGGSTVGACTVGNIDNLRLDGNAISTISGNLELTPSGMVKFGSGGCINGTNTNILQMYNAGCSAEKIRFYTESGNPIALGEQVSWGASAGSTQDVGIVRSAAGALKITDGSSGNGTLQISDPGTKPTCDSSHRFWHWPDAGGAGVADTYEICTKDAADAYAWRSVLP